MKKTNDIIIDFNDISKEPIPLGKNYIIIPDGETWLGFNKTVKIKAYHSLFIDNLKFPKELKLSNSKNLIILGIDQFDKKELKTIEGNQINNFKVTEFKFPFNISLNPSVIQDFLDLNQNKIEVTFDVMHQRKPKDTAQIIETYKVVIHLKKAICKPTYHFYFEIPELVSGYEYHIDEKLYIGNHEIMYKAPVHYAETYDTCELKSRIIGLDRTIITLADEESLITESNPSSDGMPLKEDGERTASDLLIDFKEDAIVLKNLNPNNKITIPVYLNLAAYESPTDEKTEEIKSQINLSKGIKEHSEVRLDKFVITPDSKTTRLLKTVQFNDQKRELSNKEQFELPKKSQWLPGKSRTKTCFSIALGNFAENNAGQVTIENININFNLNEYSSSQIILTEVSQHPTENTNEKADFLQDLNTLFEIIVKHNNREVPFSKQLECPNQFESYYEYSISFRHDNIIEIPDDISKIDCNISFDYQEFTGENQTEIEHFETTIIFNIEKNPGSYWLAVDYGTSACVAAFSDGDDLGTEKILVDLQKPLQKYTPNSKYVAENIEEYNTKYLASTISLQEGKSFANRKYNENLVHLSPTMEDSIYPIPYLKSLIGMEDIPNFNGFFNNFKYSENRSSIAFTDKPPRVAQVLRESYYSLLSHFVQHGVYEKLERQNFSKGELNKVIFTIPNTFTPKHISYIKDILSDPIFQNYKKEYITFLSESDAVACNYVYNWKKYNPHREVSPNVEYTLVYDMGAGTLDITYFKIQTENSKKKVTVLGKLGKATAGNYLDYLLAKSIFEIHQEVFLGDPITEGNERGAALSNRKVFKNIIKDAIKPNLNVKDTYEIFVNTTTDTIIENDIEGNNADLCNAPLIQEFILDNTHTLIENFFQLFTPESGGIYRKGEVPLNTVVFTGRSMQFKTLQNELRTTLEEWSATKDINFIDNLTTNDLKNVVVNGALQYALLYRDQENAPIHLENKNVLARYGVLYQDIETSLWRYKNLLDPSTRSIKQKPVIKDGLTIYEYDTDIYDADSRNNDKTNYVDMSNTVKGWFVQSYAKDTAADMNSGNTEYISKIEAIQRNTIDGDKSKVRVRIQIDANNQMLLSVGEDALDPTTPLRLDLESSQSFKKSMWPYL